jgi:hypothetical protein
MILKFGSLAGTKIGDLNPDHILTLLFRLQRIENLGNKTIFKILKSLSYHTKKIVIINELVKIGSLFCLEKNPEYINTFTFNEKYECMRNLDKKQIKQIHISIREDGFICITVTATNKDSFLDLKNSNLFNRESLEQGKEYLYWNETLAELNKNPKRIIDFVDYLSSIDMIGNKMKEEMLKGLSYHIPSLKNNVQEDEKEEAEEKSIAPSLIIPPKALTPQFNRQTHLIRKESLSPFIVNMTGNESWNEVDSKKSKGKKPLKTHS